MEPALLWVDPAGLGDPALEPLVLRYPDGSVARGRRAFVCGVSELVYRPDGYPDGKHVALETFADVALDEQLDELRWAGQRLRDAVALACDRLERLGALTPAAGLREAAILAGFPPERWNPLA